MDSFPRTVVGGVSLPRMIIGTNWFLGFSHCTDAKDAYIKSVMDRRKIAEVIEVFLKSGVDAIMGLIQRPLLHQAIQDAQERTGRKVIVVSTPQIPTSKDTPARGFDRGAVAKILDEEARLGAVFCMPHTSTTDNLVDRCTREIRHMPELCRMIRERGMIPGLSTHMPESIVYADESGLDVETYISIYNSMGFLMQLEVDWTAQIIAKARKPVMTIKPMAAGQLRPFQGLSFVWSTLRPQDLVTVGTMTPAEAQECVDLSLNILDGRKREIKLQETRSKATVNSVAGGGK
ncbi:MAG TPA: hypothetical protein PK280_10030 [Planctomycetota bacterium]|nr:hypothetical protein [Planctomycetota bacterium]